ncbi:MAG: methyltransferase domain-containing protein [Phycisphaerales bacterium]|nr:methyltransferase domain-containing protein [Phycisphaerales bacterium]
MKRSLLRQVARSVDAPGALIPVLPRLFEGLDALGCMPRLTARLAREAGAGPGLRVLDLGCGKGAAAVEVAARTGCLVLGVDAFGPFIDSARELAERRGVAERCEFRKGIIGRSPRGMFDGALLLNVLPLEVAAPLARRLVRPGGFYIVDDAVRVRGRRLPAGVMVLEREEARARLMQGGDEILAEYIPAPARVRAMNARLYRVIAGNTRALARERPGLRPALAEFLRRQREANRQLSGPIRPALWVVRRSPA